MSDLVKPCEWCLQARKTLAQFIQVMAANNLTCKVQARDKEGNGTGMVEALVNNTMRISCSACKDTELLMTDEGITFLRVLKAGVTDKNYEVPF